MDFPSHARRLAFRRLFGAACAIWLGGQALPGLAGIFNRPDAVKTPAQQFSRAGHPECIAPWARPSRECLDQGYYVGGGAAVLGDSRGPQEGTWGWDYAERYTKVRLDWWHGRRYQGGTGQFQPNRLKHPLRNTLGR
jgi:hypothetical protein